MTKQEKNTLLKRIHDAKSKNIFVQEEIKLNSHIRGVYGFYAMNGNEEIPFYIGKSINIFSRMFQTSGHIYDYLRGLRKTDVQKRIANYIDKGYKIEVRLLKKVNYKGDSFIQDANRLALAELREIVKQQNKGYCITSDQVSEATKRKCEEQAWNDKFA